MQPTLVLLAFSAGTQAISAPRTKAALQVCGAKAALQVRGGGLDDLDVVKAGAAALGAAGLQQWVSPKASLAMHGVTGADASALALRRAVGAFQLGLAYLLTAEDPLAAAPFVCATSILAIVPSNEDFNAPKEPLLAWVLALTVLGKMEASPWVITGLFLANGAFNYFASERSLKMYGCSGKKGLSKLGVAMNKLAGAMMLFTGVYLAALAHGEDATTAFGYTAALICAHVAAFALSGEATNDGYPNKIPLAWLAVFGPLAFRALN